MWIRSTMVADSFGWGNNQSYRFVDSDSGRIVFWHGWDEGVPPLEGRWHYRARQMMLPESRFGLSPALGFVADYGPHYAWLAIPYWIVLVFGTTAAILFAWRANRGKRRQPAIGS
jgi:hypothetical protein